MKTLWPHPVFSLLILCVFLSSCQSSQENHYGKPLIPEETFTCDHPVRTHQGFLRGGIEHEEDTCSWKGVPFAMPPVGDLRWRAPQPVLPWAGVRIATEWRPACIQSKLLSRGHGNEAGMSEDCLYLNIWRPRESGQYPVMVWFHGGAYMCGMASSPMYFGDRLSANGKVVVVTVNYRIGPFGFLAHEALAAEDLHGSTGNYGTLDQVAALQWVQENISAFGGDPDNVTIFGQSAGGWSVCTLMATPLAKGLFHRAIMESGGCNAAWPIEKGYAIGRRATSSLGCKGDDVACMREKSADNVFATLDMSLFDFIFKEAGLPFINHEDKYVLFNSPQEHLQSGDFNNVPLLAGFNRDETQALAYRYPLLAFSSRSAYIKRLYKNFGDQAKAIEALYPLDRYGNPAKAIVSILSDRLLVCPLYDAVNAVAARQPATYLYRFDYDDFHGSRFMGAGHVIEVPFVFQNFDRKPAFWWYLHRDMKVPYQLSHIIQRYWVNFAYSGSPNGEGLPLWPAYQSQKPLLMVLDEKVRLEAPELKERTRYWKEYSQTHASVLAEQGLKIR